MRRVALAVAVVVAGVGIVNAKPAAAADHTPGTPGPATSQSAQPATVANSITAGGVWNWQNPLPDSNSLYAISCPSALTCFTAGLDGPILKTSDGGATWNQQQTASGVFGLSCASTLICVGVGVQGEVLSTGNGGAAWQTQTLGGGNVQFLFGISCPNSSICYTVGSAGTLYKSADGGSTWTQQSTGTTTTNLFGISCPSITTCFVVGDGGTILETVDGGAHWNALTSGVTNLLETISCPSLQVCTAFGQAGTVDTTENGGSGWFTTTVVSSVGFTGVSCPSTTFCFATATDGNVYAGFGDGYAPSSVGEPGILWSVSCPTSAACLVAGDYRIIAKTIVGGTGWITQSPPTGTSAITYNGISCPTTSSCVAVGTQVATTTDGGATWATQGAPSGMAAVSCPSTTECFAVGGSSIFTTANPASTWVAQDPGAVTSLLAVSCPNTTTCFAAGTSGAIVGTTDSGAHWTAQTSGTTDSVNSISCPSALVCFAVTFGSFGKSSVLVTTDGGVHWSDSNDASNINRQAISCPSTSACVVVGNNGSVWRTADGGSTWTSSSGSLTGLPYAVSCATSTNCVVVGEGGFVATTTDGTTWLSQVAQYGTWYTVSCASTAVCLAAGANGKIMRTTDGGSRWLFAAPSGTSDSLSDISCPTTSTCFATSSSNGRAGSVYETTDGGSAWTQKVTFQDYPTDPVCFSPCQLTITRLTCRSASVCVGVGRDSNVSGETVVVRTADGGTTWSLVDLAPANGFAGITCPSLTACVLAFTEGTVATSSDGGATWSARTTVTNTGLTGISCPSATLCFATDGSSSGGIYVSSNGGTNWALSFDVSKDPQGGGTGMFQSIDCQSTTSCDAVGLGGKLATTTDGGVNWRTDNFTGAADVTGVSCPTASTCFASAKGSRILVTNDYGSDWSVQFAGDMPVGAVSVSPGAFGDLSAISCPSATACFAVGAAGFIVATTTGGTAWSRTAPQGLTDSISSMKCLDASDCFATAYSSGSDNGALLVTHDGGSSWTRHSPNGGDTVQSISCANSNTCYAVGWPGTIYRTVDGGSTWSYETNPLSGADRSLMSVSCPGPSDCTAVGFEGQILATSDGTNWGALSPPVTEPLLSVDCLAPSSCVMVGSNGAVLYETLGSWHVGNSGTTESLSAVSCQNSMVCFAVGSGGTVVVTKNGGATWAAETSGVTSNLAGVDCTPFAVCVATGADGTVIYTLDGTTWATESVPTSNTLRTVAVLNSGRAWLGGSGGTILENSNMFTAPIPSVSAVVAPSGPEFGESVVTIHGTGFSGGVSVVNFGATPAAGFTVVNDSTLAAITPAHAIGTVDVTVTTIGGTSPTSANDQFQFQPPYVYTPVAPQRLLDTRTTHNTLGSQGSLNLSIGGASVPASATAVVLNVTAVDQTAAGYLTVFPTGGVVPVASNLNWVKGRTVANLVTVGLGTSGQVTFYNAAGTADVVVDLAGYYAPTAGGTAGEFVPVVPSRLTDTRPGSGQPNAGSTLGPGATVNVQVTGAGGIPASGVTAVVLNVTATDTTSAGFFTVYPTGGSAPTASNLNWTAGMTVPNRVIVKLGTGGKVSIFNAAGRADAVVDVNGYFTDATAAGATFVPVSPNRLLDTRSAGGPFSSPLGPGASIALSVAGAAGVPAMSAAVPPQAVVLNVTVTTPTAGSYLVIWPDGTSRPLASDLNYVGGQTVPNLVVVKLSPGGKVDIFNALGSTNVVIDVVGWYG